MTQELCVKAMAAVYSAHAGVIGPFEGLPHLLQLMDTTRQRSLRHGLLLLVQALVTPRASSGASVVPSSSAGASAEHGAPGRAGTTAAVGHAAALRSAKANAYTLMDHGGLQLLVDVVASAHECSERRAAAAGSGAAAALGASNGTAHLITSISHADVRHWPCGT